MDEQQDPGYYREEKNEQTGATGAKIVAGCGLGCLGLVLLALLAIVIAVFVAQKKVNQLVDQHTTEQPILFEYPDIQIADLDSIRERFDAFLVALENQEVSEPLILSADEVNVLINHHDLFKLIAERVKIEFINNRIYAEASWEINFDQSIPLVTKALEGKYLNGEAEIDISIIDDKATLFIRDFQFAEKALPKEALEFLSSRNWLEHANVDPKLKSVLDKISELRVENDLLYIVPNDSKKPELENEAEPKPQPKIIEA